MKKIIIYSLSLVLFSGCVNKLKEFKNTNDITPIDIVSFDNADIDNSGEISEKEFKNIQDKSNVNYIDPMWGFYGVIAMVGILLTLSSFIQLKRKNKDV